MTEKEKTVIDDFQGKEEYEKPEMRELLESVQTNIMKAAIRKELEE